MPGGAPCCAGDREAEDPETPPCEDGLSAASAAAGKPAEATASGFPGAALASLPDHPSAMPPHATTPHERAPLPGGMGHVRTKYERAFKDFFHLSRTGEVGARPGEGAAIAAEPAEPSVLRSAPSPLPLSRSGYQIHTCRLLAPPSPRSAKPSGGGGVGAGGAGRGERAT